MVSTGLHHGFQSLEEARLLLVLDFAEAVTPGWFNGTRLHSALGYPSPAEFVTTTGEKIIEKVA
jgi:hypothetical protein